MYIVSLIPARGGSKGIPNKNIKLLNNKPLIAYSIETSLKSSFINETIVSTDSTIIADISKKYGASVPYLRPDDISQDDSPDIQFINHYITWLKDNNKKIPDMIIHLRPTYPIRDNDFLDKCIQTFINNYEQYDSLRTVIESEKSPFKMYYIEDNYNSNIKEKQLIPVIPASEYLFLKEPYNMCRQNLPKTYLHNGCIDIFKTSILSKNTISGKTIYPIIMDNSENNDIDTLEDWEKTEKKLILHM
jgi:N-acylneuraminate cytidylyltransferase